MMSRDVGQAGRAGRVGVVAIGRNEGDRLRVCLESARDVTSQLVYVDSGSSDGSVETARTLGAEVVLLDPAIPFTAARARNAGFEKLRSLDPTLDFVQFVDGDCEFEGGWIERAAEALIEGPWAVVCGRRRERHPRASVYNLICDMEWDTPCGETSACGGDSMIQAELFEQVGGFSDDLIAGEEPELCVRMAAAGGRILRMDAPMTLHDARMFSFSQWWTRAVRAGHAEAEAAERHPGVRDGAAERAVRSAFVWAGAFPILVLFLALFVHPGALALLLFYLLQTLRIASQKPRPNFSTRDNLIYAGACVLGKFPHLQGMTRFMKGRVTGRRSGLIEYKGAS